MYRNGKLLYLHLGVIHIIFTTLYTYLFMKYFGRKYSAFYVFISNVIYLSYFHIYRMMSYNQFKVGIETFYMMTICKFSSLAFAYEDGNKNDDEIKNKYWKTK